MKKSLIIILGLLITQSCQNSVDLENIKQPEEELFELTETNTPGGLSDDSENYRSNKNNGNDVDANIKNAIDRKLIWTADLRFQVKNVDSSTQEILQLAEKYDGFISDMQLSANNLQVSNTISLRVPNSKFHQLVSSVKGQSVYLDHANISSNDVTEEYVDLENRLKTKKEVRDRYMDILMNKAKTVEEILEAEDKIRIITEEIEAKEGRLLYLKEQVQLSTVTINIYETVNYREEPTRYNKPYSEKMSESISYGWGAIKFIFLGILAIWPILLVLSVIAFWKRKWLKGVFKRSK